MTPTFDDFEVAVERDSELSALASAVASATPAGVKETFMGPETASFALALLALYHLAKNQLDFDRGLLENALVKDRAALIQDLAENGIPGGEANAIVLALHDQVQKGRLTDGMWDKLVTLFGKK